MIASAPAPFARDTASVIPRSLKLPVGFAPSSLRSTRAPTRSDITGASTSGVEPSFRVTTGSPRASDNRSRYRSIRGGGTWRGPSLNELFLDDPDRARRGPHEVERSDLLDGREEP